MNEIQLPEWVSESPVMAMASVLAKLLAQEYGVDVNSQISANRLSKDGGEAGVDLDGAAGSYAAMNGFVDPAPSQVSSSDDEEPDGIYRHSEGNAAIADRILMNHGVPDYATPAAPLHRVPRSSASTAAAATPSTPRGRGAAATDIVRDRRVRKLLELSGLDGEGLRGSSAGRRARRLISRSTAAAMVAFFALAVECRYIGLPPDVTRGFFTECSTLYAALLPQLPQLRYASGVDVEGFVACIVACGLRLREDESGNADGGGGDGGTPVSGNMDGGSKSRKGLALAGFGYRVLDPLYMALVPENIDVCVSDVVALGTLRGLALTRSQKPVYVGPALIRHIHDLTDAFATSAHRRELPYKRVLSMLLEAISCSAVIDYERTNSWITAIIQETYVVRGLFQREVLHARVVSATLTLLIRQYQEMARQCAAMAVESAAMPDFTEGDELIELVWKALQDALSAWEDAPNTAVHKPLTMYKKNIDTVVQHLLVTEVERLRCYYIITSAATARQEVMEVARQGWSMSVLQASPARAFSPSTPSAALASGGEHGADCALPPMESTTTYVPSPEEEALRLQVCANILKFLLLPTSILEALPSTEDARSLRLSLTEAAARVLTIVVATEFTSDAAVGEGERALRVSQRQAQFSSQFYRRMESMLHELSAVVLQQPTGAFSPAVSPASLAQPAPAGPVDEVFRGTVASNCMQSLCAGNSQLRAFVVSEVMDTIIRLSARQEGGGGEAAADETRAQRLALCFGIMGAALVPVPYLPGSAGDGGKGSTREDLGRYGRLLCDIYEDALRERLQQDGEKARAVAKTGLPTPVMMVAAKAFWALVLRVHHRLRRMTTVAMEMVEDGAGVQFTARDRARLLRAVNREEQNILTLLKGGLNCLLDVAWPGSGILYQEVSGAGKIPGGGPQTAPRSMAPTALVCITPLLRSINMLLHLSTLFPVLNLQQLSTHHEYARYLTLNDANSDLFIFNYFRQPYKTHIIDPTTKAGPQGHAAEALMQGWETFRSCWMMFSHYGFTAEALARVHAEAQEEAAADGSEQPAEKRRGNLLNARQCKFFKLMAASATPLLRMRSSDFQQALAQVAVLVRYAGPESAKVTSTSGSLYTQVTDAMHNLCGGTEVWEKLTLGELLILRATAELEMLRATAGSITHLTLYRHVEIREFVASAAIPHAITHIIDAATSVYITTMRGIIAPIAFRLVGKDLVQLAMLTAFAMKSVRYSAIQMSFQMVKAFPTYAGYSPAMALLWCMLDLIETGSTAQVESFCRHVHFNEVPAVPADRQSVERQEYVQVVAWVAQQWARLIEESAPAALFEAASRFTVMQQLEGGTGAELPVGSRLAVLASQVKPHKESRGVRAVGQVVVLNTAQTLLMHGRVQGLLQGGSWFGGSAAAGATLDMTVLRELQYGMRLARSGAMRVLVARLEAMLSAARRATMPSVLYDGGGLLLAPEHHRETHAGHRRSPATREKEEAYSLTTAAVALAPAAAMLAARQCTASGRRQLLQYLVQGPVRSCRADLVYDAVLCWKWLLMQDRQSFLLPLLQELDEALVWTATARIGLFDGVHVSQNVMVQTGNLALGKSEAAEDLYDSDYSSRSPHKMIFSFLADMYVEQTTPLSRTAAVLRQLYALAAHLMQYAPLMSLKDLSFAETMRAMMLVGSIARTLQETNLRRRQGGLLPVVPFAAIGTLKQKWYKALLRWFSKTPPSWYFAADPQRSVEEVRVLEALTALLEQEEQVGTTALGLLDFSIMGKAGAVDQWGEAFSSVRGAVAAVRRSEDRAVGLQKLAAREQGRLKGLLRLLIVLVKHELLRIRVWQGPRRTHTLEDTTPKGGWAELVQVADQHHPTVAVAMTYRFAHIDSVRQAASACVVQHPERYANVPEAVDLYLVDSVLAAGAPKLYLFRPCPIVQALRLLAPRYVSYSAVTAYAIRSLLSQQSEELIFYLPQLLQVLETDSSGQIQDFLLRMSAKSVMFSHQLLWSLQTEGQGEGALAKKCKLLEARIKDSFTVPQRAFYDHEFQFIDLVTSLSGELMKFDKPQRKPKLRERLRDAVFHDPPRSQHLYLPTDPDYRITGVLPHTAGAMQSAAKCPILVQFTCVPREAEDMRDPAALNEAEREDAAPAPLIKGCIFKMGDDCRQDSISLQLIGLMQRILEAVGVPSYLYPYRVVTTGQDSGIIECVPRSMSRNEIGKLVESNLAEFFVQTFGHPESVGFRRARANFVKSMASYSVVSFILNIKDRHNGNIMIDAEGNLVHIDFGFLFDTSPGGDMNFESSPFKLTTEMVQLIGMDVGGKGRLRSHSLARALVDEENYIYFKTLVNRCYLAVRQYAREICLMVELMLHSGLPCFKPKQTIADLAMRLAMGKSEIDAAHYMRRRIHEARQNYRTYLYDTYQRIAEGIEM